MDLLRTLPPKVSEAFALAHDDPIWVALGPVLGHLSGADTTLGEPLHAVVHAPRAAEADGALRQGRLCRSAGSCSVGDTHSTREAVWGARQVTRSTGMLKCLRSLCPVQGGAVRISNGG